MCHKIMILLHKLTTTRTAIFINFTKFNADCELYNRLVMVVLQHVHEL